MEQTALVDFLLKGYRQELSPLYLRGENPLRRARRYSSDRFENTSRVANFSMVFNYAKLLEIVSSLFT